MKTVLFVPGFQEDLNSRDYTKTMKVIEAAGYAVEFVPINWFRTTIESWVQELDAAYAAHDPMETILAGFSFGAMTAFMSALKRSPAELWLFSLSPYFREDLESKEMKRTWLKFIGHRREASFRKIQFTELVQKIHAPTIFFYGGAELKKWPNIDYRSKAINGIPTMTVKIAEGAEHDVTSDSYVAAISESISFAILNP